MNQCRAVGIAFDRASSWGHLRSKVQVFNVPGSGQPRFLIDIINYMKRISRLKNPVQEYAWGSKIHIQRLTQEPQYMGRPLAELWMGAHPKDPSQVLINGTWHPLNMVIEQNPEQILGKSVARRFSNQLPFLFKILAAEKPLSVQVHPDLDQARQGFDRENLLGLSLDSPERNYRDPNHKPEIISAVTPFQGLKGFRVIEDILHLLERLSISTLSPEIGLLKKEPNDKGLKIFYSALMGMEKTRRRQVILETVKHAKEFADQDPAYDWMLALHREFQEDMGIFSPILLNLMELKPGEAVFLPPGELHAYLHGLGIELMANSDNVLRGGLTGKHVDLPELLNIVNFDSGPVRKVMPIHPDRHRTVYLTRAQEFLLTKISVAEDAPIPRHCPQGVEILICLEGHAHIQGPGNRDAVSVTKGESLIVPASVSVYGIKGHALFYMATVPDPPFPSP